MPALLTDDAMQACWICGSSWGALQTPWAWTASQTLMPWLLPCWTLFPTSRCAPLVLVQIRALENLSAWYRRLPAAPYSTLRLLLSPCSAHSVAGLRMCPSLQLPELILLLLGRTGLLELLLGHAAGTKDMPGLLLQLLLGHAAGAGSCAQAFAGAAAGSCCRCWQTCIGL